MARPPFLPRLLLRMFLPLRDREFIIGDLDEEYALRRMPRDGRWRALLWYWRQSFGSLANETRYELGDAPTVALGEPRRGRLIDTFRQDVRYAFRSLNGRPLFTGVAVITLALGIGANTGIFSVANWLLLRPVAGVERPEELTVIDFGEAPGQSMGISWSNFRDLQATVSSFDGLTGEMTHVSLQVMANGAPFEAEATAVGPDYFEVLGVRMQRGRAILAEETEPGRPVAVAVISDAFWTSQYQRDPNVLGKTIQANKTKFTVVGVLPKGFRGTERFGGSDLWIPYSMYASMRHMGTEGYYIRGTGIRLWQLIGRLKPGVTASAAQADVRRSLNALIEQYPKDNAIYKERPAWVSAGLGIPVLLRERTTSMVKLMLLVVTLLLIISSANVANMLLVRGAQKRPEAAVRRALGASFRRLAFQQLVESIMLALMGGAAALLVAAVFLQLITGGRLRGLPPIENVPLDGRVLLFTVAVSVITGVIFAVTPLNSIRRLDLTAELHGASSRHTARGSLLRSCIVTVQIGLSLVLLVGALLLSRTMGALLAVDTGFDLDRLAGMTVDPEAQGHSPEQIAVLRSRLLDEVRAIPGVADAALTYSLPMLRYRMRNRITDPLQRSDEPIPIDMQFVSDGYFKTIGIPLLRGREIQVPDWMNAGSDELNVVLNETAAKTIFGSRDPLGQTLTTKTWKSETLRVVGVVRDVRMGGLTEPIPALVYWPMHANDRPYFSVVLRTRGDPHALEGALRKALAAVEPNIPLDYTIVTDNIRDQLVEQRLLASLFTMFSALAVLLAAIGLYGVLGSSVNDRRRELGIRMALGAKASRVLGMIVAQSAKLVMVGVAAGVLGAFWLSRMLESQLFGVSRTSPTTYILAAGIFSAVALLATVVPTRAATRVHPSVALKHE